MPIEAKGRMIRRDISRSQKFASLSRDAQRLFPLLIPWLNAYGKMNGQPSFIQGECVPLLKDFTIPKIHRCLFEISEKTNVKWFEHKGMWYIHSLNFLEEHQDIRSSRIGRDMLPSWACKQENSRSSPGERTAQVEVEVKGEVEVEVEVKDKGIASASPAPKKFQKPTPEEIQTYAQSINFSLDGERFWNYYESNGWMVGKNPMKNWRAAVKTWKLKAKEQGGSYGGKGFADRAGGIKEKTFGRGPASTGAGSQVGETKPKPGQFAEFS